VVTKRQFLTGSLALGANVLVGCGFNAAYQQLKSSREEEARRGTVEDAIRTAYAENEALKDPDLAVEMPNVHYSSWEMNEEDTRDVKILVESDSRNVFIAKVAENGELEKMLFRAPVVLGRTGRRASGNMYTSSFTGPGAIWIPSEDTSRRVEGVFGRFFMPMQNRDIAVNRYEGGWGPVGYNRYAIHGTDNNAAFESTDSFLSTNSRGCVRVYDGAINDLRSVIESCATNLRPIDASLKNPRNGAYALGRTIPVEFGNYFPEIRNII